VRKLEDKDILEITADWRARAEAFMRDASQSRNLRDVARLAGLSSTLVWCSIDLCVNAGVEAGTPGPLSPEADKQVEVADAELRRGQREPKAMSAISIPNRKEVALAFGAALREVRHQGGCHKMFWRRVAMLTARIRPYLSVVYVIQPFTCCLD